MFGITKLPNGSGEVLRNDVDTRVSGVNDNDDDDNIISPNILTDFDGENGINDDNNVIGIGNKRQQQLLPPIEMALGATSSRPRRVTIVDL